ncbi:MAG TPA: hypothetical protein VGE67_17145, partial [Haloferula sp.]
EESSEGPARKYYRLTPAGKALGEEMQGYFQEMAKGVNGLPDFTEPSFPLPKKPAIPRRN